MLVVVAVVVIDLINHPVEIREQDLYNAQEFVGLIMLIGIGLVGFVIYFVPTLIAAIRKHGNLAAIMVINLFIGWTLLGWVGAFVWAVINVPEERHA